MTPLRLAKLPAHRDMVGSDKIEELIWWVKGKNKHFERPTIGGRTRNESRRRGDRGCAVGLGHVEAGRALLGIRWGGSGFRKIANLARSCDRRAVVAADDALGIWNLRS